MSLRYRSLRVCTVLTLGAFLLLQAQPAHADRAVEAAALPERALGKADAPLKVEEFASLTCSHCAEFQDTTLEKIKANYIDTGKVRYIFHDFPLDGVSLRLAAMARCMPEESYHPFINMLFKNQMAWIKAPDPVKVAMEYARLGGLSEADAKSCINNEKLLDALIAVKTTATEKHHIEATPTFIINGGAEILAGAQSYENFAATFDRMLTAKKK